ncbi:MAG: radical SAM protein [Thermodesulfobacteriota bacterium]|nr:radical SAM protein [Thermodesulfobacteriota bacterium]
MNIVLITPTPPDINAFGVRSISSVLKKEGITTRIIFLPGGIELFRFNASYIYRYSKKTLAQIAEICSDAHLIGVSFMSQYIDRALQITEYLKGRFDTPIIWGGTHPTHRPSACLEYCDIVCIGEGEHALVELSEKISKAEDYTNIKSCWFKVDGKIKENEQGTIIQDLDQVPYVDYDLEDHYVFESKSEDIICVDDDVMKEQFVKIPYFKNRNLITYRTMTSRGCPHRCSYCASSAMKTLRRRTVDNVIDELEKILRQFSYIELISFFDDTYFAAPVEYFEEFRDKYKRKIALPFHAQCSPTTASKQKLDILVDAGLYHTEMGIQSGSHRIKKMYRRLESNQKVIDTASLIDGYRSKMLPPYYHIILDNPWETKADVLETLRLILMLPGKFKLSISSLILFPGTELNEKATQEGILQDEISEVCRKPFAYPKGTYLNYLIYLSGFSIIPRWLLRLLSKDVFVDIFHDSKEKRLYGVLFFLSNKVRVATRGVNALLRGDIGRIIDYFRRYRSTQGRSLHGR